MVLSKEQGKKLLKIARAAIESELNGTDFWLEDDFKKEFSFLSGIFVTLTINKELRGCIGYPEAMFPLYQALVNSAVNAAFDDPRFEPLTKEEYKYIDIEVTVLTEPEEIKVKDSSEYLHTIKIGRDGLIAEKGHRRGLLLPQVPVEWKWNVEEFLGHTCDKAGLSKDSWKSLDTKIYKFEGQIFSE
jgi:uncharacterized protein (TIGR00296 family)